MMMAATVKGRYLLLLNTKWKAGQATGFLMAGLHLNCLDRLLLITKSLFSFSRVMCLNNIPVKPRSVMGEGQQGRQQQHHSALVDNSPARHRSSVE
jgi:hypothetical protein